MFNFWDLWGIGKPSCRRRVKGEGGRCLDVDVLLDAGLLRDEASTRVKRKKARLEKELKRSKRYRPLERERAKERVFTRTFFGIFCLRVIFFL